MFISQRKIDIKTQSASINKKNKQIEKMYRKYIEKKNGKKIFFYKINCCAGT